MKLLSEISGAALVENIGVLLLAFKQLQDHLAAIFLCEDIGDYSYGPRGLL